MGKRRSSRSLKPLQLGQLVELVPSLLAWLRDAEAKAGDLFLREGDSRETQKLLLKLLDTVNLEGDPSIAALRHILSKFVPEVVACAVRVVVLDSQPQLVPKATGQELVAQLAELNACETARDCAMMLGPFLDDLPRKSYTALAELCAFWRDTSSDTAELACLCGPVLLGPQREANLESEEAAAAAAIMDLLIEECELIFGRASALSKRAALGERRRDYFPTKRADGAGDAAAAAAAEEAAEADKSAAARDAAHVQQLVTFYNWRDPAKADRAHMLVENYDFVSIARGVHEKYPGALPSAWKAELAELAEQGDPRVAWFEQAENGGTSLPAVQRAVTPVDRIVDEIVETEHIYLGYLEEALAFGKQIKQISRGQNGPEAAARLGLRSSDIDMIFGFRLENIVQLSKRFLACLEVIDLVREEPRDPQGRAGFAMDALLAIVDEMHVYAPYVSAHNSVRRIIKDAESSLLRRGSFKRRPSKSSEKALRGSFPELWQTFSRGNERLHGQSLSSVLVMPIQRVPRYRLLCKDLCKKLPVDHPAYGKVERTTEKIEGVAGQINEALRQHEKLAALLGDDLLVPSGSARTMRRTASAHEVKMVNLYPTAKGEML